MIYKIINWFFWFREFVLSFLYRNEIKEIREYNKIFMVENHEKIEQCKKHGHAPPIFKDNTGRYF